MAQKTFRILFTGGGSGGHIYPLVAIRDALDELSNKKQVPIELFHLGPRDAYQGILKNVGIRTRTILSGKVRRYLTPLSVIRNFFDIFTFVIGFVEAFFKVFWLMPDVLFSKGGTGSFPVVVAAWFYRIPVIIHESDVVPGMSNSLAARFAFRIAVSFERTLSFFPEEKTAWVGNPVRSELVRDTITQATAKEKFGFDPPRPLVLVLGASQGSERINEFIVLNLAALLHETQVLHQTGFAHIVTTEKLSKEILLAAEPSITRERYVPIAYLDADYAAALSAADLVVSRAGSGSIFEIAAFGKPAILIPILESAHDHQRMNAFEFAKTGGGVVIEESNLLPGIFLNQVKAILSTPSLLQQMSVGSRSFSKPQAAQVIAEEILGTALLNTE